MVLCHLVRKKCWGQPAVWKLVVFGWVKLIRVLLGEVDSCGYGEVRLGETW